MINFENSKQKLGRLVMVKSRYTFEKREREKAKRRKQIEKLAQRMMAKKANADLVSGITADDTNSTGLIDDLHPLAESINNTRHQQ